MVQTFDRFQLLNESYQVTREFTLQLQERNPRVEAKKLFNSLCKGDAECETELPVKLGALPEVGWEFDRYLSKMTHMEPMTSVARKLVLRRMPF